ncbi:hypothetical protein GUJ93_ZPchr0458g22288 [Zizania palustris]|uniref:Uncharacterized protein n=1 Tax=Zizania palustris TaxID=103762 RepID=A0A8J5RDT2_ZIZPA|nr:hypothetical protein GUJ93_ZPchr0458g22288 [Zizania palustris]
MKHILSHYDDPVEDEVGASTLNKKRIWKMQLDFIPGNHDRSHFIIISCSKFRTLSVHETKRPCWEQCLRHLQRDRRTETAVDLTVWSRFRVTDSSDRASAGIIILLADLWKSKTYLRTSTKA